MKRLWLGLLALLIIGGINSCAGGRALMQTAPKIPASTAAAAMPPLVFDTAAQWEQDKPRIIEQLQNQIYGKLPLRPSEPVQYSERLIARGAYNKNADVYEWSVRMRADLTPSRVVIVKPAGHASAAPSPIILMQNFCPNHNVIAIEGISRPSRSSFSCDGEGVIASLFGYFFGRYITSPPVEMIMERGYALAVVFPPDFLPDNAEAAQPLLKSLSVDSDSELGAIGAWAWQASRITDVLEQSAQFSNIITYGHSRYGKSALVAAAMDGRIDGVISHQSGTGGASLSKDKPGETVASITQSYPHWFTPAYVEADLTLDQHHLLAVIAPRPILLGNAKRDVWSDPEGAFRAAQGASSIYSLYGSEGLRQTRLVDFAPASDIAFWMRPGTHGVTEEDWPAFLDFMDAHFE